MSMGFAPYLATSRRKLVTWSTIVMRWRPLLASNLAILLGHASDDHDACQWGIILLYLCPYPVDGNLCRCPVGEIGTVCPCRSQGLHCSVDSRLRTLELMLSCRSDDDDLVNDLRGHTYCCGSERGLFHTILILCTLRVSYIDEFVSV